MLKKPARKKQSGQTQKVVWETKVARPVQDTKAAEMEKEEMAKETKAGKTEVMAKAVKEMKAATTAKEAAKAGRKRSQP